MLRIYHKRVKRGTLAMSLSLLFLEKPGSEMRAWEMRVGKWYTVQHGKFITDAKLCSMYQG